jgi:hypothetical protein
VAELGGYYLEGACMNAGVEVDGVVEQAKKKGVCVDIDGV